MTKLILNHIALGDDGCVVLFKFLCSDAGRSTNISEINLAQNGIGDRGLIAISEYLSGNKTLKELYLQSVRHNNNAFSTLFLRFRHTRTSFKAHLQLSQSS